VVQALYEISINENRSQTPIKEILANIVEQSDYEKKMNNTNLKFAEKIYEGVMEN
jgi:transcription termination factor NusB